MSNKKQNTVHFHDPNHILIALASVIFLAIVIGYMMGRATPAPRVSDVSPVIPTEPAMINDDEEFIFCTTDAKICPDGTGVGRVGPNCEFSPCP